MNISLNGKNLIQSFENCKLEAYLDEHGIPTIGWGATHYFDAQGCPAVKMGDSIDQNRADNIFNCYVSTVSEEVTRLVTTELNQNQFDAMVSMVYNIGMGDFKTSHLLDVLNLSLWSQVTDEMLRWDHVNHVVVEGLLERRKKEVALFLTPL